MPAIDELLIPIEGDNPSGANLRYDPVYDKIKEARREDADLAQGAWQTERKVADWPLVIRLSTEVLSKKSKDLQIAAWLTEAWVQKEGFGGLRDGLELVRRLVADFWDTVYPEIEDDDVEMRATPMEWIGLQLGDRVKGVPITRDGFTWIKYNESRTVGYENQIKTDNEKKSRDKLIKEGKLTPEEFDKSFAETPKAVYLTAEKNLDACLEVLKALDDFCTGKFGNDAPSFSRLQDDITVVRHVVHQLLQKKRETEPDPVEESAEAPAEGAEGEAGGEGAPAAAGAGGGTVTISLAAAPAEPPERREAIEAVANTAAFLRKREPGSPAPYLMMRGLRWGEVRAAIRAGNLALLEPPPTELRRQVKQLAVASRWADLFEVAESAMALPCSRAWLDLQRFVVEACAALGGDYDEIAKAIRSELRALIRDVPQIVDLTLSDDTPAANIETRAWLKQLGEEPEKTDDPEKAVNEPVSDGAPAPGWQRKFVDSYQLALEAMRRGQESTAIEIMLKEVERQRSGRGKFLRRLQLVELCVACNKPNIAQPILDDIAAQIEEHKLDTWEDRDVVANALVLLMRHNKNFNEGKEKQKLFDRVCRLNPARAALDY
jgi:type VI secretion system protein ImpA